MEEKGGKREERTLTRRSATVLCGLIGERIDLIRILLLLGRVIITRGDHLLLGALLGLRCRGRRRGVSLDLLATAPDGGVCGRRRCGLALGPTGATLGGFGGWCGGGASGFLSGLTRALGGGSAWRCLLFFFDIETQGLIDCMCPIVGGRIETGLAEGCGKMGRKETGRTAS
jgi:hypothetical protein